MSWQKGEGIVGRQLRHHGLSGAIAAGQICQKAESLYPEMFKALSCREGVLKLEVPREKLVALRLVEGKLLKDLQAFALEAHLPSPARIQLTFPRFSDRV